MSMPQNIDKTFYFSLEFDIHRWGNASFPRLSHIRVLPDGSGDVTVINQNGINVVIADG